MSRRSGELRRELARDHEPRTLRSGDEREPRPSRADEREMTSRVHQRDREERAAAIQSVLGHLTAAERELMAAREQLPAIERLTRRDLDRIRQAIARIRDRYEQ